MQELEVDPEAGFRVDLHPGVATFTLNRPDRLNSQSPRMWTELDRARRALPGDIRVAVLRGDGRAFSAGLDRSLFSAQAADGIPGLASQSFADVNALVAGWQQAFDWTSRADLVSIAAVHGHAIGAGFQLALGADIRILADDAQLTMAEPTLGLVPDLGGTKRLVELIGYSRAVEICLTGRRVDAAEALRIGLASRVVAAAELAAAVEETVGQLLAVDRNAAAETKALLQRAGTRSQDDQQASERAAQYRRLRTLAGLDD